MSSYSIIHRSQLEGTKRLDAEYYQPEYLELLKNLQETGLVKLWGETEGKFITGPFGSEFNTENYVSDGEHRYVRGKDVKDFFLADDDNVYVPEKDFNRLKKYSLNIGDILISVVGTPGTAAIVDSTVPPALFSCKSTVYRVGAINPFYFVAYLNCKYGRKLLERSIRGALQTGLNIGDLRALPVYVPDKSRQERIANIVTNAKEAYDESKSLYSQAEQMLLRDLKLEDFDEDGDLWNVVQLSEMKAAGRMDAEYFQPKYEKLLRQLEKRGARPLGELVTMKKGVEPGSEAYTDEGKFFIRVSNVSRFGLADKDQKYLSDRMYKELKDDYAPKVGEILLTKDATPGIACVLAEKVEGVVSGGVLRLKLKENMDSEYLTLCINSLVGRLQAERDAGGSIIAHWKPEQIKQMRIPTLPETAQQKIAELVRASHAARAKAHELLKEAKRTVEEWVERSGRQTARP